MSDNTKKAFISHILSEADRVLNTKGVRVALTAGFALICVSAGLGIVFASSLIYLAELLVKDTSWLSVDVADAFVCFVAFLFTVPFVAGYRMLVGSICRGEMPTLLPMFIAFSSFRKLMRAYISSFIVLARYVVPFMLVIFPVLIDFTIFKDLGFPVFFDTIMKVMLVLFNGTIALFILIVTSKLTFVSYFLWSEDLSVGKSLSALSQKITTMDAISVRFKINLSRVPKILLTALSVCVLLVFHTGPYFAICNDIAARKLIEKKENSERKVNIDD